MWTERSTWSPTVKRLGVTMRRPLPLALRVMPQRPGLAFELSSTARMAGIRGARRRGRSRSEARSEGEDEGEEGDEEAVSEAMFEGCSAGAPATGSASP